MSNNKILLAYKKGYRVLSDGSCINRKGDCVGGSVSDKGYMRFGLRHEGKRLSVFIHRLQAYQKYGESVFTSGIVVRHLNGNSLDNSWDNIAIGTHKQNAEDIPPNIRLARSVYASSFIRKYDKLKIISFYNETKSYSKTMQEFGISSKGTLHYILNN